MNTYDIDAEADDVGDDEIMQAYARNSRSIFMHTSYGTMEDANLSQTTPKKISKRDASKHELEVESNHSPSKNQDRMRTARACVLFRKFVLFIFVPFLLYCMIRISDIESTWVFRGGADSSDVFPTAFKGGEPITVVLIGDQLASWPFEEYDMATRIKELLPGMPLNIFNHAKDGFTLNQWGNEVYSWMKTDQPDAVFIFATVDVTKTDVALNEYTAKNAAEQRIVDSVDVDWYRQDLHKVLGFLALNAAHVALAGPGPMGEGPIFKDSRFDGITARANTYKSINQAYSARYENCQYIDLQQFLLSKVPWWYPFGSGFVTVDGEKPNYRGSLAQADLIAHTLRSWYWPKKSSEEDDLVWDNYIKILQEGRENKEAIDDALINKSIIDGESVTGVRGPKKAIKTVDSLGKASTNDDYINNYEAGDDGYWGAPKNGTKKQFDDDDNLYTSTNGTVININNNATSNSNSTVTLPLSTEGTPSPLNATSNSNSTVTLPLSTEDTKVRHHLRRHN